MSTFCDIFIVLISRKHVKGTTFISLMIFLLIFKIFLDILFVLVQYVIYIDNTISNIIYFLSNFCKKGWHP